MSPLLRFLLWFLSVELVDVDEVEDAADDGGHCAGNEELDAVDPWCLSGEAGDDIDDAAEDAGHCGRS